MRKIKGFTLIELLVVIAIIALLIAIIVPALGTAKKFASSAACLSNVKQLVLSWRMYTDDNDDKLCGPGQRDNSDSHHWVGRPKVALDWTGGGISGGAAQGTTTPQEILGIQNGALYPYYEDYKLAHCPADKRSLKQPMYPNATLGGEGGYRTYSIPHHLNGEGSGSQYGVGFIPTLSSVPNPGSKYVFLEENDSRNYNWNSWRMDTTMTNPGLIDPFGVFHGDKGIMGFADGHANKIVWKDDDTKAHSQNIFDGSTGSFNLTDPGNVDLLWLAQHYPHR